MVSSAAQYLSLGKDLVPIQYVAWINSEISDPSATAHGNSTPHGNGFTPTTHFADKAMKWHLHPFVGLLPSPSTSAYLRRLSVLRATLPTEIGL